MENLIFANQNRLQSTVYDQNTNTTFIQFSDFSDIKDFYKRIENKEVSRFICSKMDRNSQTYILALEY